MCVPGVWTIRIKDSTMPGVFNTFVVRGDWPCAIVLNKASAAPFFKSKGACGMSAPVMLDIVK